MWFCSTISTASLPERPFRSAHLEIRRSAQRSLACRDLVGGRLCSFGTLRPDGTPHPHAGTGFLVCEVMDFPMSGSGYYGTVKLTDLVPNQRLGKSLSC